MSRAIEPLGLPPDASNDYVSAVKVPWGMLGNDQYGDCVQCDTAHSLMLRTANAGEIVVPSEQDVLSLYTSVTGFDPKVPASDQGTDESTMCEYLQSTGFLGHKASSIGSIDPKNLDYVRWCIQLFGTCRIGLNLPYYADDQFTRGQPWDISTTGDQETGGHDVPLVDYRGGNFSCITWGKQQTITPAFLAKYCEEAHVELYPDWIRAQGTAPSNFNLAQLMADLQSISNG